MVRLILGDCLDVMRGMADGSIDAVVTSPPYYNARDYSHYEDYDEYLAFLQSFFRLAGQVLKQDRILAINVSCVIEPRLSRSYESSRLPIPFDCVGIARSAGFKFLDDIIWQKPDGASSRAIKFSHHRRPVAYKPFQVTEYILIFKNGHGLIDDVIRSHDSATIDASCINGEYERTNVWAISPERTPDHPASFPVALAKKLVTYYSFVGDTILDPFMGSGTTGVAAVKEGRHFVGCDNDPGYFKVAEKRITEAQMQLPLPFATGD